ncbi:MAG: lytic transglycosylase domain-containing protein [Candidatus Koribacter versatilis]|uniref:Lytic transglycosylase domain-containing protein n=1 Tax=Candidatus Korobacter versatilis TaxID=658062 RepID=A0A932A757_9BACT|nr:lytic transglycosylase domain-containing protein [Candidatus Koribacter versatilis]
MLPLKKLVAGAVLGIALPALAADVAVLRNGFEVRHERREVAGDKTRLYVSTGGYVEVASSEIAEIQREEYIAPAPTVTLSPASPASAALDVHQLAATAAGKHQIDEEFIEAVIRAESSGNPRARSPKGAQGLMQLMPQTASTLGVKDAYDPAANVDAGTRHLRALLEQYNGDAVKALAAYNAGAQRVAQYHGVPPYRETQAYIRRIIRDYNAKKLAQQKTAAKEKSLSRKAAKTVATATVPPSGD